MLRVLLNESVAFAEERVSACFEEAKPLLESHWAEITFYKDIDLDPNWGLYLQLEEQDKLRAYSVREHGELKGYAVYILQYHPHYAHCLYAEEDILYVVPEKRSLMIGARFIQWCDEQLKALGVQVVQHHSKIAHDYGPLLKRLGYEPVETIWCKRLDKERA